MRILITLFFIFIFFFFQAKYNVGYYEACAFATAKAAYRSTGLHRVVREVHTGQIVRIVEIRENMFTQRIRGKLDDGSWISIKDTESGHVWFIPLKLVTICCCFSNNVI